MRGAPKLCKHSFIRREVLRPATWPLSCSGLMGYVHQRTDESLPRSYRTRDAVARPNCHSLQLGNHDEHTTPTPRAHPNRTDPRSDSELRGSDSYANFLERRL
jgi:hypothetical protein